MMQLITPDCYAEFASELREMHGLRYRVFKKRLDWEVQTEGEMETDPFDSLNPVYLLLKGSDWRTWLRPPFADHRTDYVARYVSGAAG